MPSAGACRVFEGIQQSKLMRCISINRVLPLWEGKEGNFLLSQFVSESENQTRLDCVSHVAAEPEKPFSWYSAVDP